MSFVMWRVRNVLQILVAFFLWDTIFSYRGGEIFGYDKGKILTYILGLIFIKAFVLSARAQDVAGEIARGEIINYMLKPVSYFKYWLTRDISSKALNLAIAVGEFIILYIILKPPFFFQSNIVQMQRAGDVKEGNMKILICTGDGRGYGQVISCGYIASITRLRI